MTDKDEQLQHLRDAVDRKAEAAEAGRNPERSGPAPEEIGEGGEQRSLVEPARGQDVGEPRQKSSRKGHVTADKWNQ
jgi:hypothetical protein